MSWHANIVEAQKERLTLDHAPWIYLSQKMMLQGQPPGKNVLDSGAHFYESYRTKDCKFMTVGAKEPQFYAKMLKRLDIQDLPQCFNNDEAG